MQPHTNPARLSGQSNLLPAEQIRQAIDAMRSASEHFTKAAVLTREKSHTDRLVRLVAKVDATIPPLLRIERDLEEISRRPA
jgi:hypothetical protein